MKKVSEVQKEVHVIGGGISGLFTAFYLVREGFRVKIFEKKEWGGLIDTHQTPFGLVEQAANAFIANKELEDVADIIGTPLVEKKKEATKRYIFKKGKARRWPLGVWGSFLFVLFVIRAFLLRKTIKANEEESLAHWGHRQMGREAVDYLITPGVGGIYGAPPRELNASLVFGSLLGGSKKRGRFKGSVSGQRGMGSFVKRLVEYLKEQGCLFVNEEKTEVDSLIPTIIATDLKSAQSLLKKVKPEWASLFEKAQSCSLTALTLHFEESEDSLPGFGCLFPEKEKFNSLGVLFNHHTFDHRVESCFSETWIFNDHNEAHSLMDKEKLVEKALQDRLRLRGFRAEPLRSSCYQWTERIPLYSYELKTALESYKPDRSLFLMGNYMGQLGLSKILLKAKDVAQQVREQHL